MAFLGKFKQSFGSTFSFFTDSWSELKKVRWPGRKELITYTMVVLFTVIFVTLYFYLMDLGISRIIESVF
ncbi:MAG: preprotein translocase subunit SecE [Paenibacillaceae bacterium]